MARAFAQVRRAAAQAIELGLEMPLRWFAVGADGTVVIGEFVSWPREPWEDALGGFNPRRQADDAPLVVTFCGSNNQLAAFRIERSTDDQFETTLVRHEAGLPWATKADRELLATIKPDDKGN